MTANDTTEGTGRDEFSVSADKYRAVVKAQRDFLGSVADRVESGEPVARANERSLIAGILRAWANRIPDAPPEAGGKAPRIDPGFIAIHFACLVNGQGLERTAATAELASIYDVSPEAIGEAIAKFEGQAMRLVPKKAT